MKQKKILHLSEHCQTLRTWMNVSESVVLKRRYVEDYMIGYY